MKIKVLPADDTGCGSYRLIYPANALRDQGHDVEVLPWDAPQRLEAVVRDGQLIAVEHPECDVLVVQRIATRHMYEALELVQKMGVRVVVDMDDNLTNVPARNAAHKTLDPRHNRDHNYEWGVRACELADAVVVTTDMLRGTYGRRGNAHVVPNFIPESYFDQATPEHEMPLTGWAGNMDCHAGDLLATKGGVGRALREVGTPFRLIGVHGEQVARELGLSSVETTGWFEFPVYPIGLGDLDLGIVPLEDNRFNQSKSWLKGLEMASVGVPFVASGTRPYRQLEALGAGITVVGATEWYATVKRLLVNSQERAELRDRGVDCARTLTVEKNAWRFLEAWVG